MAQIDEIIQNRLEKLKKIREIGWDPYASTYEKKHTISESLTSEGKIVKTAGKITSLRTHGDITFADIKDESERMQVFFRKEDLSEDLYNHLELLDIGDYIGVEGVVGKTKSGEISIIPTKYTLLTKSLRPLPKEWYGLKDVETRYRKRYLDLLINEDTQKVFATRAQIIKLFRNILDRSGFFEVETPVLQPIYGGATAQPFVTHHNALDHDFYLRISDELYLKRLIVAGYEKVYEISKVFRNEGLSRWHSSEFTMLEFYWAYADYEDLMKFTEKMLTEIVQEVKGSMKILYEEQEIDFAPPWPRVSYVELFKEHLNIDLNEIDNEKKLLHIVEERKLLDEKVVGYGHILDRVYKSHIRPKLVGPMFLTDHPVDLKPLAKRRNDDPTKSAGFQLLVLGAELINAYNELNDPVDQRKRWENEVDVGERGGEEHQVMDEDYIEALEYGMPPTAGWGMGIDRFAALLTDQHSIKDAILFPTLRPE
ncbi:lysine--tRNA ligase [Candidatus Roizmanbacteria bacterium RIFCSPLOWO2_02_FULL_37_19]|uniref:Lysine--tRNA ligase n=1 Tax=Candidatus Roizmanbacteria bacterium RIFCSPHIGHO2_02_FULL_37_24 TaxID=1802037 RepID=A0A1F7H044_9BACT|nr:MAG: lysine--tRNA ligase [Candidatus Roizmanbacteria bacterium RIFCSPHIGHO2_01_FULL_38_41]OGK24760.1 MAG: lysine--tRNA ligase [Candidatus Roizmanbacteria bacterium RIFCSPHIGHO2_02_FULL_37_24]OGK31904.1 MAG: lysine--tRNA ligase [Candidatus Roizmanbacteria bacterium RIFCSPHIGHO2_12_FULL_37_23]OGK45060.1 MAG: lysine--tRNA ligase [Candidatus Roizmanbacteria bacterium RIFCSPLOWO2_01_FULL_37_57]OGK53913.1 MAG: lysine--tRNA ligase [Candidatus Roizmanbacteria bacterium RIFCSPLOWO2_02_FULL_37_19]OGK